MSTTLVSSVVGMAVGLVQVGVATELGLDASVLTERKEKQNQQMLPILVYLL